MHHPKGNKIIRSSGRNFHLNINDDEENTSNDYDDDNDINIKNSLIYIRI